jgi:hypothetical protein
MNTLEEAFINIGRDEAENVERIQVPSIAAKISI